MQTVSLENLEATPRVHFMNLDILRFIAAFAVACNHGFTAAEGWTGYPNFLRANLEDGHTPNELGTALVRLNGNLALGVEFFFLISGFLITYLILVEQKNTGTLQVGKFYIRRILRVWPLYFLVLFTAPLWIEFMHVKTPDYLSNALFMNNFHAIVTGQLDSGLPHFWSISVEEHFYLFWPLLLFFIPSKRLPWLFGGIVVSAILFRFFVYYFSDAVDLQGKFSTLSRIDTMAFGGWIAWYAVQKPIGIRISRVWIFAIFLVFAALFFFDNVHANNNIWSFLFKRYAYTLLFAFALVNCLYNPNAFISFKKKNVLHYFGKISFGMYVYHNLLLPFVCVNIIYTYDIKSWLVFWPLYLLCLFVVSILSFELFEKHFLKLKERFVVIQTRR